MHFIPGQAAEYRGAGRAVFPARSFSTTWDGQAQGTPPEYAEVLKLAKLPRVILKFSGWDYYKGDLQDLTKRIYGAFGPDRMIWGTLGNTVAGLSENVRAIRRAAGVRDRAERAKIRGANAIRLFFCPRRNARAAASTLRR